MDEKTKKMFGLDYEKPKFKGDEIIEIKASVDEMIDISLGMNRAIELLETVVQQHDPKCRCPVPKHCRQALTALKSLGQKAHEGTAELILRCVQEAKNH